MTIWKISLHNIKSKPLYAFLSIFILSLSIALLLGIQQIKASFQHQIAHNLGNIDLVIGAKGSPLQLTLASVLHLDHPTGNIPYKTFDTYSKNPMIDTAIPISYGDTYKGYRIVGSTPDFLTLYKAKLEEGLPIQHPMEVIIGHTVAQESQLKIGDTFLSSHGLIDNDIHIHEDAFTVVGILKPTQKVIDRLIICNLDSIWDLHHHDIPKNEDVHKAHQDHDSHDHHDSIETHAHHNEPENPHEDHKEHVQHDHEHKDITSLLITLRTPSALLTLPRHINEATNMQAAIPKYELNKLYEYTGVGITTITLIAYIILVISGITIFISLYKMVKERAFDLALMRSYGASNFQLIKMLTYEALAIVCVAFLIGWLLIQIGLYFLFTHTISGLQQHVLQALTFDQILPITALVLVMTITAIVSAIYPIIRMNISTILSHEK